MKKKDQGMGPMKGGKDFSSKPKDYFLNDQKVPGNDSVAYYGYKKSVNKKKLESQMIKY